MYCTLCSYSDVENSLKIPVVQPPCPEGQTHYLSIPFYGVFVAEDEDMFRVDEAAIRRLQH